MAKPPGNPFLPKPQGPQIPWPPHPGPQPSPKAREAEPTTRDGYPIRIPLDQV